MKKLLLIGSNTIHFWRYLKMIRNDFDVVTVITTSQPKGITFDQVDLSIMNFSFLNPISFSKTIKKIKKIIRTFCPDIIHVHQANTVALATLIASRGFKIPVILTAWGSDVLVVPNKGFFYREMVKYNLNHATILSSDSLYMENKMRELVPDRCLDIRIANFGIGIIPNPSIPKENIVYSNRSHKKLYRIETIIIQFKNFINSRKEPWRLLIAGIGPQTEKLKLLAKSLGIEDQIDFVGWLDAEKNALYYNKAMIYVSIPESDATSISLLEAMACGCISVVSNIPANLEWIVNDLNGIVADDLSSSFIERALQLDMQLVKQMNNFLIEKKGTVEVNHEKFLSIYNDVLKTEE